MIGYAWVGQPSDDWDQRLSQAETCWQSADASIQHLEHAVTILRIAFGKARARGRCLS
jgi:hypothetical protein